MSDPKEFTPVIYLVRHAKTDLNDPKNERLRSWSDVPIDFEGREHTEMTAKKLEGLGIFRIISSDLQRAIMTSSILNEKLGVEVRPDRGLRPWNLGDLTGKPVKEVLPKLEKLAANRNLRPPHGESFNEFLARWEDGLHRMQVWCETHPDKPLLGVVHSRNMLSLNYILAGGKGPLPQHGGPAPGDVVKLVYNGTDWQKEQV